MAENDIYRVTVKYKDATANQFRLVFHFRELSGTPGTQGDWSDWKDDLLPVLCPILPDSITIYGVDVHKLDAGGRWQPWTKIAVSDTGDVVGDVLPYQSAAVALGFTSAAKTIAKKWLGPISESQQAGGVPAAGLISNINAFLTFWQGVYQATNGRYESGSWSKLKGFHAIISTVCSLIMGSQRRRKPGVGA